MSMAEYVDGTGWISDDSDFYGGEATRTRMESLMTPESPKHNTSLTAHRFVGKTAPSTHAFARTTNTSSTPTSQSTRSSSNVVDFLKSRPQVASMQTARLAASKSTAPSSPRTVAGISSMDLVDVNMRTSDPASWQPPETVLAFLQRASVAAETTADLGPWLWVRSPHLPGHHLKQSQETDQPAFMKGAVALLGAYKDKESKIEVANPGKAPGTITRYMRQDREQLEDDLLQLAVGTHTTCGKWMLFPTIDDVARVWRVVAKTVAAGKLGPTCKVATYDVLRPRADRLICIYTYDFTDLADVRRVLDELVKLDLVSTHGRPIYYKCDAYTYLDLGSQNEYKIRASLYSSKDVLNGEVKALPDGPILRLLKRKGMIDTFMSG